jgi:phage terminase small subunit
MAEIDIEAELRKDNRSTRAIDLRVFADALRTYHEASANIRKHGAIVMHPRTGAPLENPYLKVQEKAGAVLTRMRSIRADRISALLADAPAERTTE